MEWLDYDSGSAEWTDLVRYPTRAIGATEWSVLPDLASDDSGKSLKALRWLRKLQSMSPPSRRCPRIFIAHLQADRLSALKMARIVSECGFHFWLDVLDPQVKKLESVETMVATSAIIEMAVLNCTHAVAIGNGSPWVSYAFGRLRTRAAYLWQAGTWPGPGDQGSTMGLDVIVRDKPAILDWLNAEFAMTLGCPRRQAIVWDDQPSITNALP